MAAKTPTCVVERSGRLRVWRRADVSLASVLDTLSACGPILKSNGKSETKRVGGYLVKSSAGNVAVQVLKHTAQRERYRRGWRAAHYFADRGIPAPKPFAHVEWSFAGVIWKHATITEYLPDCVDVEHYYDALVKAGASLDDLAAYLSRLADAVNRLAASAAIHTDLAGKNILTRDGQTFYFIDLEGVILNQVIDEGRTLQAHVQLYDSFIDRCDDSLLAPFIRRMLPQAGPQFDLWFARVKAAQALRRARTVAVWKREGRA